MVIIRFLEENIDGCETDVEALIEVDTEEYVDPNDCQEKFAKAVREAKNELREWSTDDIIEESIKKVFGDVKYRGFYPDFEVVF